METVMVHASKAYPVHIGGRLLDCCGELIAPLTSARRCLVVSDSTVAPLYAQRVLDGLGQAGFSASLWAFPAGEQSKNLATYGALLEHMAAVRLTRSDFLVALGGGVVGDLAGFAAATYQRGIDFVQMPTSLLAAVDASVGGKTAIDLNAGKNLAGAFHQPLAVLCDTEAFRTLQSETFLDGVAETVKHGLIADKQFFDYLMTADIRENIDTVVRRNVGIKAAVVEKDEREHGTRKLLNFGHTLGHAIEKRSGYAVSHGHAVAIGMVLAARGAERIGLSPAGTLAAVLAANRRLNLPTDCPYGAAELYDAATADKKRSGDSIDVVVLEEIGRAGTVRLDMEGLRAFTEAAL